MDRPDARALGGLVILILLVVAAWGLIGLLFWLVARLGL